MNTRGLEPRTLGLQNPRSTIKLRTNKKFENKLHKNYYK